MKRKKKRSLRKYLKDLSAKEEVDTQCMCVRMHAWTFGAAAQSLQHAGLMLYR